MEAILIYRPLIFALIEYTLMAYVLIKGKYHKYVIAALIFFLATYQLGEFVLLTAPNSRIGLQIAFFATTMLPPVGLKWISNRTKKNYGFVLMTVIALTFGSAILLNPFLIGDVSEHNCFIKFSNSNTEWGLFIATWGIYYFTSLTYTMGIMLRHIFKNKMRSFMIWALASYISFYPTSFVAILLFGWDAGLIASVMCSFAIFTAFITAKVSVSRELNNTAI